jgi:transcriptional regulator with XRE-family HTH domain
MRKQTTPKPYPSLTANQLVAYNMHRARKRRGWSQEELARRLQEELKQPLGQGADRRQIIGNWEASPRRAPTDPKARIKQFDADELVALAFVFDLSPIWFLLPPEKPDDRMLGTHGGSLPERPPFRWLTVGLRPKKMFHLLRRLCLPPAHDVVHRVGKLSEPESDGGLLPDKEADKYQTLLVHGAITDELLTGYADARVDEVEADVAALASVLKREQLLANSLRKFIKDNTPTHTEILEEERDA